jgi:hypothetical protein
MKIKNGSPLPCDSGLWVKLASSDSSSSPSSTRLFGMRELFRTASEGDSEIAFGSNNGFALD